jgi:hypothetical protein
VPGRPANGNDHKLPTARPKPILQLESLECGRGRAPLSNETKSWWVDVVSVVSSRRPE